MNPIPLRFLAPPRLTVPDIGTTALMLVFKLSTVFGLGRQQRVGRN